MTEQEKVILQSIDPKFKYIARDKDGGLCVYIDEPDKSRTLWSCGIDEYEQIDVFNHLFENVK